MPCLEVPIQGSPRRDQARATVANDTITIAEKAGGWLIRGRGDVAGLRVETRGALHRLNFATYPGKCVGRSR
jgi:hypothetical protein